MYRAWARLGVISSAVAVGAAGGVASVPVRPACADASAPAHGPAFHTLREQDAKLKLVQVVFRHGARTPLAPKPDIWQRAGAKWDNCGCAYTQVPLRVVTADGSPAPFNSHNHDQVVKVLEGGCHAGQLTEQGQLQALDLGTWLRHRYVDTYKLLPAKYQEGLVSGRTTNFQRTIATLGGVLTGLLGSAAAVPQPLQVTTSTELQEILYADTQQCPHLKTFMRMGKEVSKGLVKADPEYPWARAELQRVLGVGEEYFTRNWHWTDVHDVLTALAAADKPLPEGFTPRLRAAINRLATKEFAPHIAPSVRDAHGHAVLQLSMGVLLATLVTNMESAAVAVTDSTGAAGSDTGYVKPAMYLYSGHDSTVMPILSALGMDVLSSWPPYLSNIVFELWQLPAAQGGQHVVRVLYNRETLDIPHCPPGMCASLGAFRHEVVGPFLMSQEDVSHACKVTVQHETALPHTVEVEVGEDMSMASRPVGKE